MIAIDALLDGLPSAMPPRPWPGCPRDAGVPMAQVRRVVYDSRRVEQDDLFVVWRGARHDGRRFAPAAFQAGAVAVLADDEPLDDARPLLRPFSWWISENPRALLGPVAARLEGHPEREVEIVGVTGTNGKTSVTHAVGAILEAAGQPAAVIGTVGTRFRDLELATEHTTPEGSDLMHALRTLRDAGAESVALEVSSHALAQGRVTGLEFDVAVFTNLSRDHLDFHHDLESYFRVKSGLFDMVKPNGACVVCVDDSWGQRLADSIGQSGARVLRYAADPSPTGADSRAVSADIFVRTVHFFERGFEATVATPRGDLSFASRLLGRFHLANLLAAIAVAEARELDPQPTVAALEALEPVIGRLEAVEAGQEFPVLIDYAHTGAALEKALLSLRELTERKIIVVFGCGGDRDAGKRPVMGRIAGELADLPILTNDNPRTEDPAEINAAVEEGLRQSGNSTYRVLPDRREAIRGAISFAASRPGEWCVLVAGKGHETQQIIGTDVRPFSDRLEIERAVEDLLGQAAHR